MDLIDTTCEIRDAARLARRALRAERAAHPAEAGRRHEAEVVDVEAVGHPLSCQHPCCEICLIRDRGMEKLEPERQLAVGADQCTQSREFGANLDGRCGVGAPDEFVEMRCERPEIDPAPPAFGEVDERQPRRRSAGRAQLGRESSQYARPPAEKGMKGGVPLERRDPASWEIGKGRGRQFACERRIQKPRDLGPCHLGVDVVGDGGGKAMAAEANAQQETILGHEAEPVLFVVEAVIETHEVERLNLDPVGGVDLGDLGYEARGIGARGGA